MFISALGSRGIAPKVVSAVLQLQPSIYDRSHAYSKNANNHHLPPPIPHVVLKLVAYSLPLCSPPPFWVGGC